MNKRTQAKMWLAAGGLLVAGLVAVLAFSSDGSGRARAQSGGCPSAASVATATPGGAFSVSVLGPCSGATGQPITFTAVVQNAGASTADLQYFWTFGDGAAVGSGNPLPHTFTTAGNFTVSVAVQGNGRSATGSTMALVAQSLPISANGPYTGNIGQSIEFQASAAGAVPADLVFQWDFGDGSAGSNQVQPSHIYNTTGVFNVTLTAASASAGRTGMDKTTATIGVATPAPTASSTPAPTASPAPRGPSATYPAGWNIVGGATGQTYPGAVGPLYTYQAGDSAYEILPQGSLATAGKGYWAFFSAQTTVPLFPSSGSTSLTIPAPVNQYVMVGNPSQTQAETVSGADFVYTFDQTINNYRATNLIPAGGGVWVLNVNGGTISITP